MNRFIWGPKPATLSSSVKKPTNCFLRPAFLISGKIRRVKIVFFIHEHGHDRTPIFIKGDFAFDWLTLVKAEESHIKETLLNQAYHPELKVTIDRPLKAGWEKRK